ncbi:MAG: HRDC domain-containing protein, partial [Solirubrobacterales bacterium]
LPGRPHGPATHRVGRYLITGRIGRGGMGMVYRGRDEPLDREVALKTWRARTAPALALDISVILPQRLIDRVAEKGPRHLADLEAIDGLRRWRIEAFGKPILDALDHIA